MNYFLELFSNQVLSVQRFNNISCIFFIFVILILLSFVAYVIVYSSTYEQSLAGLAFVCIVFLSFFVYLGLSNSQNKYILDVIDNFQFETEQITYNVNFLPNQVVDINNDTFIIDNKKTYYKPYNDTLYIDEDIEQPYIVVTKYKPKFNGKSNFWFSQKEIDATLKEYNGYTLLEEVHY